MALRIEYQDLDGLLVHQPVSDRLTVLQAQPGIQYRLVSGTGASAPGASAQITVRRLGDDLRVDGLPEGATLELSGFFLHCTVDTPCQFDFSSLAGSAVDPISPSSIPLGALSDDSFVLYAPPSQVKALSPAPEQSFSMKPIGLGIGALLLVGGAGGGGGGGAGTADTQAPAAPELLSPKTTSEAAPVLSGTAEPGAEVIVTLGTEAGEVIATWRVPADGQGQWRIETGVDRPVNATSLFAQGVPDGEITVLARAVDGAGNISELSTSTFLVSRIAADGTITISRVLDDFGLIIGPVGAGASTDDALPTVEGTLSRALATGERVVVYRDGVAVGEAEVSDNDWSFTEVQALVRGEHAYQARVEDAGAQAIAASNAFRFVLDDQAPAAPTVDVVAGDDRIDSTEKADGVSISGRADALSHVRVQLGSVSHQALADENGQWLLRFEPADLPGNGVYSLSAVASDAAGNVSDETIRTVSLQAEPPLAPTIDRLYDDTGFRIGTVLRNERSDDAAPRIDGHFATLPGTGDRLEILRNGVILNASPDGRLVFDGTGGWSFSDSGLGADGVYEYSARVIDASGQSSNDSAGFAFVLDRVAPDAPEIDRIAGNDRVSFFEARRTLIVTGEAESGSTVTVTWDDEIRRVLSVDGEWAADFTGAVPDSGTYSVTASARDEAGNLGPANSRTVRVDRFSLFSADDAPSAEPLVLLKSADLFDTAPMLYDSPVGASGSVPEQIPAATAVDPATGYTGLPPLAPYAPFDFA